MDKNIPFYDIIDEEDNLCISCHNQGIKVPYDTVLSLTNDFIKTTLWYEYFFLCTTKTCHVAYYSKNKKILTQDLKTSIWFKQEDLKMKICYCRDITLEDIIKCLIDINGEITVENIVRFLKKENLSKNCLMNMPLGEDCNDLFLNAIEYAKKVLTLKSRL